MQPQILLVAMQLMTSKKLGNIDQGVDIEFFEEKILKDIDDCLSEYKDLELIIYPHPREKTFFNFSYKHLYEYYLNFAKTNRKLLKHQHI